jgi:cell division septation protein DedD
MGFKQLVCLITGVFLLALGGGLMGGRLAASARIAGTMEEPRETTATPVVVPDEPAPVDLTTPATPSETVAPRPVPAETPPPPAGPVAAPAHSRLSFVVQATATPSRADARNARKKMMAAGLPAGIFEADLGARGTWYRVYVGPYETEAEARQVLDAVRAIPGYGESFVKPLE